jgi:hypothetical protein
MVMTASNRFAMTIAVVAAFRAAGPYAACGRGAMSPAALPTMYLV